MNGNVLPDTSSSTKIVRKTRSTNSDEEFDIQAELENYTSTYCKSCKRSFATNGFYREHVRRIHLPRITRNACKINPKIKPDPHDLNNYCCSCDYTYKSIASFRTHLKRMHQIKFPLRSSSRDKIVLQDSKFDTVSKDSADTTVRRDTPCTTIEQEVTDTAIGQNIPNSDTSDKDVKQDSIVHHDLSDPMIHQDISNTDVKQDNPSDEDISFNSTKEPETNDIPHLFTHDYVIYDYLPRIDQTNSYCQSCQMILLNRNKLKTHIRHYHQMKIKKLLFILEKKHLFNMVNQKFGCLFCEHTLDSCYRHLEHMAVHHRIKFS